MLPALTPGETANTLIPKNKKKHRTVALKDKASVILVPFLFFSIVNKSHKNTDAYC